MLVLSRKAGEKIVIGENIAVVVMRVAGNRVTLGIEAPEQFKIVRGELDSIVRDVNDSGGEIEIDISRAPDTTPTE